MLVKSLQFCDTTVLLFVPVTHMYVSAVLCVRAPWSTLSFQ